jgi:hypothetical protein
MKKLIYILGILLLCSCSMKQKIKTCDKWGVCRTDTVITTYVEILKDTIVKIQDSKATLDMLFECDSLGQVYIREIGGLNSENTDLKIKFENGKFTVIYHKPEKEIVIQYKDIIKTEYKTITKLQNYLTEWQKFRLKTWFILAAVILIFAIDKIRKLWM